MTEKLTTYETKFTATLPERSLTLYATQSDTGRMRIDEMDLNVWQMPGELADWLEWCAARIREVGK